MTPARRHVDIAGKRRHLGGWRPDRPDHRDRPLPMTVRAVALPKAIDLRASCPPIYDQGSIGSCVANAIAGAGGFVATAQGRPDPMLSRLDLYAHARSLEGTPLAEDSGCEIRDAIKVFANRGVCLEPTWPYVDDGAHFAMSEPPEADVEAALHKATAYYRCGNMQRTDRLTRFDICASLSQHWPVAFGFSVPNSVETDPEIAKTGIVKLPTPDEGYIGRHAVLAIGYDVERELFIIRNSWGTEWGDAGYGYLPFAFVDNGLAGDPWAIHAETGA